jgi:DMSO/TMAO reductase YedYZ molybdopterin-dependent catalytic subunit
VIKILYLLIAFLGWGAALGWVYRRLVLAPVSAAGATDEMAVEQLSRRQFLIRAGTATAAITVVGTGLSVGLAGAAKRRAEEASAMVEHNAESIDPSLGFPNANDPIVPVPGTRPEYTPIKDHYRIFIRTRATEIDPAGYTLPISGMVDNMLMLTLDDLRNNYPVIHRYVTLSCISNNVGGNLIGTTLWSGASFKQVLADAGLRPGAKYVQIHGGDGFYETVSLDLINSDERIILAYDWDGAPIPFDHGAPLRIYIPDRYGMKQPKWITGIEVIEENRPGYWVDRGWDEIAQMRATSVIDTVAVDAIIENGDQRLIPIGGIAHAGDRGVSKVEVSVDGGEWMEADLRSPLSDTTWVIWRIDWPFAAGDHTFMVRMTEGDGTPQLTEVNEPHPSGATGIDQVQETIGG